jgi:hypothetical protein
MFKCKTCHVEGESNFYKTMRWYCKKCWNIKTARRTKDNVRVLKEEYGGKCSKCGYDKCMDALQFHHLDPSKKEFSLGQKRQFTLSVLRKELEKCILVCANCHAEIHSKT